MRQGCGQALFQYVLEYLETNGSKIGKGTLIDAMLISAPCSTKNKDKRRDPELHQIRKGYQWVFGMKTYIGVDTTAKAIHAVATTAANIHEVSYLLDLLHGDDRSSREIQLTMARPKLFRTVHRCTGFDQPALSVQGRGRRGAVLEEPAEIEGQNQGRTRVPGHQMLVRPCQDPPQGIRGELVPVVRHVCGGEFVPGATTVIASGVGEICLTHASGGQNGAR